MPTTNLKNISIDERQASNGNTYFIIFDNDTNQAYFCWENNLKDNWQDLVNNWQEIKEVEIEYIENEKGKKVISLYVNREEEVLIY